MTITGIGTTGTIAPDQAGTVILGSKLNIEGGAQVEFDPGETDFANGSGIDIGTDSVATVAPTQSATITHKDVSHAGGKITVEGRLEVKGSADFNNTPAVYDDGLPVENSGIVRVIDASNFIVTIVGSVSGYYQSGGTTSIQNGSILTSLVEGSGLVTPGWVTINGGDLRAVYRDGLAAAKQEAMIDGSLYILGDTAVLVGYAGGGTVTNTLHVTGDVAWTAGTYNPFVNGNGATTIWKADGKFNVSSASVWIGPTLVGTAVSGQSWKIIQGSSVTNTAPTIDNPWSILMNTPVTEWDLKYN